MCLEDCGGDVIFIMYNLLYVIVSMEKNLCVSPSRETPSSLVTGIRFRSQHAYHFFFCSLHSCVLFGIHDSFYVSGCS